MSPVGSGAHGGIGARVAKGATWYVGASVVQRASGFVILPFITAAMSVDAYGQTALLISAGVLLLTVLGFGLDLPVFRAHFSMTGRERDVYLRTLGVFLRTAPVVISVLLSVLLLFFGTALLPVPGTALALETLGMGALSSATTFTYSSLRARQAFAKYATILLAITCVQTTLRLIMVVALHYGVSGWAFADCVAGLTAYLVSLAVVRLPARSSGSFDPGVLRSGLAFGLPMVPHLVFFWLVGLSDRFVLSKFEPLAVVAHYSIAFQLAAIANLVLTEVNRALMPEYGRQLDADSPALTRRIVRMQFEFSLLFSGIVAVASPIAVAIAFPEGYQIAAHYAPILAIGNAATCLYYLPMNCLTVIGGESRWSLRVSGAAAFANLAANIALVPIFGVWIAVWSSVLSGLILLGAASAIERRHGRSGGVLRIMFDARGIVATCLFVTSALAAARGGTVAMVVAALLLLAMIASSPSLTGEARRWLTQRLTARRALT